MHRWHFGTTYIVIARPGLKNLLEQRPLLQHQPAQHTEA